MAYPARSMRYACCVYALFKIHRALLVWEWDIYEVSAQPAGGMNSRARRRRQQIDASSAYDCFSGYIFADCMGAGSKMRCGDDDDDDDDDDDG
ncbi:hypothetical protein PAAG_05996 [Paracoccidioides lutzii Pb01]|uniref:Uncharacterized protein n=1 Tax=Paracoccidioides lutzii (strain ATCC MYA-826 / Pb01) TaxID=502779 RepID=C1H5F5_PARBA|nr:hypothetical protein PAAG_05996 [Paracoccidioides lutzii Pb01]EEH34949.2 hypothetical protein PAAG_05996 [Paracoccidioides lutzii Pb01]